MSGIRTEATQMVIQTNGVDGLKVKETGVLAAGAAGVSGLDVATVGQIGLSKYYESPEQTIASAGARTIAHGMGTTPKLLTAFVICKTAEYGYSIGDVAIANIGPDASASTGAAIVPDATNITIRYGSNATVFVAVNKTSGVNVVLTNSSWNLIVRAWA